MKNLLVKASSPALQLSVWITPEKFLDKVSV